MSKLSVVLSTNRPHRWAKFCESLMLNSTEMEIIFVGPNSASDSPPLPITCRFITTNDSPAKCWERGVRVATSDFLCMTCDDFSYTPGFFDDAIELAKTSKMIYHTYAGRYIHNGADDTHAMMMLGHKSMPFLNVGGLSFVEGHHKIGGIDKRFVATLFDCDLYMRMFVEGGRCTLIPRHATYEDGHDSTMFNTYSAQDKAILKSLWFDSETPQLVRKSPVESYTDEELLCPK